MCRSALCFSGMYDGDFNTLKLQCGFVEDSYFCTSVSLIAKGMIPRKLTSAAVKIRICGNHKWSSRNPFVQSPSCTGFCSPSNTLLPTSEVDAELDISSSVHAL